MKFTKDILKIDCGAEAQRIQRFIREQVFETFRRKGAVVGVSGGIDSAVVASLCVGALGAERVFGLILPEKESNPVSARYADVLCHKLGLRSETVDITPILEHFGVYEKRGEIVRRYFPEYNDGWKFRLTMPQNLLERDRFNVSSLEIQNGTGKILSKRLSSQDYRAMVAATDIKQRVRMTQLYYAAERENYIVAGTTNVPETIQGFFVKHGDGGVDIEPIAHLYKSQVYQLGEFLDVPQEILSRSPSPDTYSFTVSDQEMYFCLPYDLVDLLLYAKSNGVPRQETRSVLGLDNIQIDRVFRDFDAKEKATRHLRQLPPSPA